MFSSTKTHGQDAHATVRAKHPIFLSAPLLTLAICAAALTLAGCQTQTYVTSGGHTRIVANPADGSMSLDQALDSDPCAVRMDNIEAALLTYYALYKKMPPNLEAIAPMADVDQPLYFTSPITGAPFGYSKNGLVAPGRSKRIIVYETVPEHPGHRWCIRMQMTAKPTDAQSTEVVKLSEKDFEHYLKNG